MHFRAETVLTKHPRRLTAIAALAAGLATTVQAEGTLKTEGGLGFVGAEDIGIFSLGRVPAETPTSQLDYGGGMAGGPASLTYRSEANWAFDLGNTTKLRVGGILSGLDGSSSEYTPLYYLVAARPGGPEPGLPEAEISVCPFPDPCITFDGEVSRSYHEVMPELMVGRAGADGSMSWFGLQGFSGRLDEQTSNRAFRDASGPGALDRTTLTDLDADAAGLLLAFQHERTLESGLNLFVGGGIGRYEFDASAISLDPAVPSSAKPVSDTFDGTRAQLAVGLEKPMGKGMTLGATVRADYWTNQPRIEMDWSTPPCSPTLCSPPSETGNFNLTSDPLLSISVGVSLTWRM